MKKLLVISSCAAAALHLTGCGASSGSSAPTPATVANTATNVLQFAVGTANIYGDLGGAGALAGLNVVATYRQPASGTLPGGSGALVDSPTLTVPGALPAAGTAGALDPTSTILTGSAPSEAGKKTMTSTAQTVGATTVTTFGQSGGVFGLGIEPFNYTENGAPLTAAPYPVPIYDALAADANQLSAAWGGPPAFDLLGNGQSAVGNGNEPSGTAGISLGLDVFAGVAPVAGGTYTLALTLPANTATAGASKSFTLPGGLVRLPAFTPPVATLAASGGATFAVALPAGVTQAYVEITDVGPVQPAAAGAAPIASCNGASTTAPVYYTLAVAASGTYALGAAAGPGGTPSLCTAALNEAVSGNPATSTGDQFAVQGLGFDYPLYAASYPKSSGNASPVILGAAGEDDITVSSSPVSVQPAAGAALTSAHRMLGVRAVRGLRVRKL